LSNNRRQVGKHYIGHWNGRECFGLFPSDLNVWYGANAQAVVVNNWADDNFDHSGLGFIGGASLTVNHEGHPVGSADMPLFGRAPAWGSKWKAFVRQNAGRWRGAYAQCTSLPYENTYIDLDPEVKDPLGDPVCRITSGRKENEPKASAYAAAKAGEWFRAAGAIEVIQARRLPKARTCRGTLSAAHAWATTPQPTSWTSGASHTKRPTSVFWADRSWVSMARAIRR